MLPLVTSNSNHIVNINNTSIKIRTASGAVVPADGEGTAYFQLRAQNQVTGEVKTVFASTGSGQATLIKSSQQDLISSSWLSRAGIVTVNDHVDPHAYLRGEPDWRIACEERHRLWYLPLCVYQPGCANATCATCHEVRHKPCYGTDGTGGDLELAGHVHNHRVTHFDKWGGCGRVSCSQARCVQMVGGGGPATSEFSTNRKRAVLRDRRLLRPSWTADGVFSTAATDLFDLDGVDVEGGKVDSPNLKFFPSPNTTANASNEQVLNVLGKGVFLNDRVLDHVIEDHERKAAQDELGIKARPSAQMDPRVPKNYASPEIWHHRTGCSSERVIKATSACVRGMNVTAAKWDCDCSTCFKNKSNRPDFKAPSRERDHDSIVKGFQNAVMDFKGPLKVKSRLGNRWMLVIACRSTDAVFPGFSKNKSAAPRLVKNFLEWAKSKNLTVESISSDSDSTFTSREMRALLLKEGIDQFLYLRSHRGINAERAILIGLRRANAILIHAMMSEEMCEDACVASYRIHNRLVNVDHHNPQCHTRTRLELVLGETTDWMRERVPLCTVFPIEHGTRYGHMRPRVLPGAWILLGPSGEVSSAWRILNTVTMEERVHYHLWFLETMKHRQDALTNFDAKYLRGLERLSSGKVKANLTIEEKRALRLRELYASHDTTPFDLLEIEGDTLTESNRPNDNEKPKISTVVPREGTPVAPVEEGTVDKEEKKEEYKNHAKSAPEVEMFERESQGNLFIDPTSYNQTAEFNAYEEEEESKKANQLEDDEYSELVEVKDLRKQGHLSDGEIRAEKQKNLLPVEELVTPNSYAVPIDEFLKTHDLEPERPVEEAADDVESKVKEPGQGEAEIVAEDVMKMVDQVEWRRATEYQNVDLTREERAVLRAAWDQNLPIKWRVLKNPKSKQSKTRFQSYWNDGKNDLGTAKTKGMTWGDFKNDFQKGFFEFTVDALQEGSAQAAICMPLTNASNDESSEGNNLVSHILFAQTINVGAKVVTKNMHKSTYKDDSFSGELATVVNYDQKTLRYLIRLAQPVKGRTLIWVRTPFLDELGDNSKDNTTLEAPPKLVAFLEGHVQTQRLREQAEIICLLNARVRELNMDLDDHPVLTTTSLYELMSEGYKAAMSAEVKAHQVHCPINLKDSITCSDKASWVLSLRKEVDALEKANTWEVVHRSQAKSENKRVMKSGFVFRVKADENGYQKSFEDGGYKSRFVCKGYSERYGEDFWNVRSGVVDYVSARILIALAASECGELHTYDVKNAFVSTPVPEGEEFYC